nr:unnamed protein product [Callosobruchus chinensis]
MPKDRRSRKHSRRLGSLRRILERLEKRRESDSEESSESSLTDESDSESGFLEPQEAHLEEPLSFSSVLGPSITGNQQVSSMLGDNPNQANRFGPNIHEELEAVGLFISEKDYQLREEKTFCPNIYHQKTEIRSLLPAYALKNDRLLSGLQEQLGAGMAILGSILSQKLGTPDRELILENDAVEKLAEAGQLFANVHQAVSSKRKFEINLFLDIDCRSADVKACLDDYLFGSDFFTKVKANREMKKAADEIRRPVRSMFTSSAGPSGTQSLNAKRPFHRFKKKEDQKEEINTLITKGAISECTYRRDQSLSSYFSLKKSNEEILEVSFQQKLYQFTCLPFGLNVAPFIFTKLLKPVIRKLWGRDIFYYLLMFGHSVADCARTIRVTLQLFSRLVFIINRQKSVLSPTQNITYLGYIFNSIYMRLELPSSKVDNIEKRLLQLRRASVFQNKRIYVINRKISFSLPDY